ncbi:NAD(P)-dependent oxidoreductase [soil metagenome]
MAESSTKDILESRIIAEAMIDLGAKCQVDAKKLGNAHILVTGGTGFFGSWVLVSFVALRKLGLPIEMTVLSRDPAKFLANNPSFANVPGLVFRKGDVMDSTIPFSITHILHFATAGAKSLYGESDQEVRSKVVDGTRHLLAEAKRVGAARLLLASSGAVYGRSPKGDEAAGYSNLTPEDALHADARLSAFGAAKREAEALCRQAATSRDLETVIVRGFTFGGPLFPVEGPYAISTFMSAILNDRPLQVKSPDAVRSFLDGRDLAVVLWRLLASGRTGEAYNVGSDESVSMTELADLVRAVAWKVSLRVPEIRLMTPTYSGSTRPTDIYRPCIDKLAREFGWRPTISLRQTLRDQAEWALARR